MSERRHGVGTVKDAGEALVERARLYATRAHQRIDQRRKYSGQPYHVHLEAVAELVASVTDDAEMIAAAWLHDTVEDTPATLEDIEREFGPPVAELVEELTDVSRPGDGNRAQRKAIDRQHLAQASARAKTVKLADLIDNCRDIVRHDRRFARVYLAEMARLLEVLGEGDETLMAQAHTLLEEGWAELGMSEPGPAEPTEAPAGPLTGFATPHFRRLFAGLFVARDIAGPLLSFSMDESCATVGRALQRKGMRVASLRSGGRVRGYVRCTELSGDGACGEHIRHFTADQILPADASLADVVQVLTRHEYCFLSVFDEVSAVIGRGDMNRPVARMWLFGIITMVEMLMVELIDRYFPHDAWQAQVSPGRLAKAREIQAERERRGQPCRLIDCLQLSDKGQIVLQQPRILAALELPSRRTARKVVRELESLRNNLAHAQDIVQHDWAPLARLARRMEELSSPR